MNKVELLAPAKNYETAVAAINSGADAIYIGASYFGARHNAKNTLEDIEKLVNFAHKFYVRVHVTINTILNDYELKNAIDLVKNLYNIGVDAIIIQDMGLLKAAIDGKIPPIHIHMSTQCDNRSLEKAIFFDSLGVSRIILARELSIKQIEDICKNTSCEIETFIHGALCVSYSGQCYLSYANGGRSANRGECAQPCRKKYSLIDETGKVLFKDRYLLSLKDFNASESIEKLISCGVKSFKIEGRLKDVNYVKNVVASYSELLNKYAERTSSGRVFLDFEPNINKTFNRGYTDYFLNGRTDCFDFTSPKSKGEKIAKIKSVYNDYFTIDADLVPQDGLCFVHNGELKGFLVNRVIGNKIYPNKMDGLKAGLQLYRNYDALFDKQLKSSKTMRKIGVNFELNNGRIYAIDEDNNSVSLAFPTGETPKDIDKMKKNLVSQLSKTGNSDFYVLNTSIFDDKIPFIPISEINEIRRELLRMLMNERLSNFKRLVQKPIGYKDFYKQNMDYRANVLNNEAFSFYKNCNCNIRERALEASKKIPSGVELMRTKHCLKYASRLCGKSCQNLYLVDENKKYPLKFDCKNCEMVILNP
ncbi:U32 family peptidase [bacterium]|nr:U32 family peptidase [bacterium]